MPIVVVDQEKTVLALATRLLRARTPRAARERAVRAIREANPGLDLDRLRPGTILVVPRLKEARGDADDVVADALAGYADRIRESLDTLAEAARGALGHDQAERDQTAEVFEAEEVRRAAGTDEMLRATLERLRVSLEDDRDSASRRTDTLLAGIERWSTDLDDLGTLW